MKKRTFCAKPLIELTYVLRYITHDGTKNEIVNTDYDEVRKVERYLKEKGVKDLEIAVRLPNKKEGSDMFPVNN